LSNSLQLFSEVGKMRQGNARWWGTRLSEAFPKAWTGM